MINLILDYLAPVRNYPLLDLYCGCGNFSLFLAQESSRVVGIDSNTHAIAEALHNAQYNKLMHCSFLSGDVEQAIESLSPHDFSAVLLNPPRQGCTAKVLDHIAYVSPKIVVYISCNPATLARDLKHLIRRGFCIETVQPVDMFPQTYHIETVVKLVKS